MTGRQKADQGAKSMVRKSIVFTAAALASAAGLALAAPAHASDPGGGGSWDHTYVTIDGGGTVHVQEHGDLIELCDTKADGLSVRVEVSWDNSAGYVLYDKAGNGTCTAVSATTAAKYDLPENKTIYLYIAASDNFDWKAASYLNDH
jgi:hypothetical protein